MCENIVFYGVCYKENEIKGVIESNACYKAYRKKYAEDLLASGKWYKNTVYTNDIKFDELVIRFIDGLQTDNYKFRLYIFDGLYYLGIILTGYTLENIQAINKSLLDEVLNKLSQELQLPLNPIELHYLTQCTYHDGYY